MAKIGIELGFFSTLTTKTRYFSNAKNRNVDILANGQQTTSIVLTMKKMVTIKPLTTGQQITD